MTSTLKITILVILTFSVSMTSALADTNDIQSPHAQFESGVPIEEIQCRDDRVLMQSPTGSPACIFSTSVLGLIDRGFVQIEQIVDGINFVETEHIVDTIIRTESAIIPDEIASANNAFAINFYKQIANDDGNQFFSPSSMQAAFSMLYEGTRGETAKELRDVFGIIEDDATRYQSMYDAMSSLSRPDPDIILESSNALWLTHRTTPHKQYVSTIHDVYRADVKTIDFVGAGVSMINEWTNDKTHGKTPKILEPGDVSSKTTSALFASMYFKGNWTDPFNKNNTYGSEFKTVDKTVTANFMNQKNMFGYAKFDDVQILRMPYVGDRLSMLVVLPSEIDGIDTLGESLSVEMLKKWQNSIYDTDVRVSIPKFELKTNYDLIPKLKDMGIRLIFSGGDFSGISNFEIHVDKAKHSAYVNINEEETEAASFDIVVVYDDEPPSFIANHPFLFFIQDNESGSILFMGKMVDPTS